MTARAVRVPGRVVGDASAIASAIQNRELVSDDEFDLVYPRSQRRRSERHWTPLEVALRASALLALPAGARVLDVGAGVGKVCLLGALASDATWVGVERDRDMIEAARVAATALSVAARTRFVCADISEVAWSDYEAFYLFNPFAELLWDGSADPLARRDRYVTEVEYTQRQLAAAPRGTRVVTYFGFGGDMPSGYVLRCREPMREGELELWERRG